MKRILFLVPSLDGGGAERATLDLASGLDNARFDVTVVTEKVTPSAAAYSVADHVKVISLNAPSSRAALRPLRQLLKRQKPSILYSALPHLNALAVLATRAWHQRPLVITSVHNNLSREFHTLQGGRLWKWLTPWVYRNSHRIVCVSNGVAADAINHFGALPQKIRVIPNPIDISAIKTRALETVTHPWFSAGRSGVLLVAAGRLVEQKNYPLLINVTRRLIDEGLDVKTVILGEGPLRNQLIELVQHLGIENHVSFVGRVQNPYAFMHQADVFILASDYEGFGMVLVEAMASGTPIASTDCDFGPNDILDGGRFGILTPVGSISAMVSAVSSLTSDPTRRKELTQLGLERAMQYNTPTVCAQFEALLDEVGCNR